MIADRTHCRLSAALALAIGVAGASSARAEDAEARDVVAAQAPPSEAAVGELVETLESDDYATRMGAQSELLALSTRHAPTMLEMLVGPYLKAEDPDLRARLRLTLWNAKRYELDSRPIGFVGVQMQDSRWQDGNRLQAAVQIMRVIEGTAAQKNDLRLGDLISAVDGVPFAENELPSLAFKERISARTSGEMVELTIIRGPHTMNVKLRLGERPIELLEPGDSEMERMEADFNAFLKEEAEKRGLPTRADDATRDSADPPKGPAPYPEY